MEVKQAVYTGSFGKVEQCPQGNTPEFAFIGRSNVGKSSLINMLCKRKDLARVSQKPGKTQSINFYHINNDAWILVDLPGYGYARTSKTNRVTFAEMIRNYLTKREALQVAMVLIDANIPPQKLDIEFLTYLAENAVPFTIIFTKADKPKTNELAKNIAAFKKELSQLFDTLPNIFVSSAERGTGREDILNFIDFVTTSK
jgi:GTP-binding protein